jgi:hypothetical protein
MPRPETADMDHGQQGWDTVHNDNMAILTGGPFPIYVVANFAALPAASAANENCLVVTQDTDELWQSDGAAWRLYGPGHLNCNGARGLVKVATTELTLAGASTTWAGAFPAGVRQVAVSGRVTLLVTTGDGATGINVGDHGAADPDRYKANLPFALNGTFTPADATADPGGWNAGARDVVLSAIAGTFSGGKVRLFAVYLDTTAPTS